MADAALVKKLGLKPDRRALLLGAPAGYRARLEPLPPGVTLDEAPAGEYDFVQVFVADRAALAQVAPAVLASLRPTTLCWVTYPKQRAKLPTDLTRDHGWEPLTAAGWEVVAVVAIDDVWSALRFRPRG